MKGHSLDGTDPREAELVWFALPRLTFRPCFVLGAVCEASDDIATSLVVVSWLLQVGAG